MNCISPGFIATEILDIHPQEWRDKWYSMIPANRMAQTYELKGVRISTFLQDSRANQVRLMYFVLLTHQAI